MKSRKQGVIGLSILALSWSIMAAAHAPVSPAEEEETQLLDEREIAQLNAAFDSDDLGDWTISPASPSDILEAEPEPEPEPEPLALEDATAVAQPQVHAELPKRRVLKGTRTLACVGVQYTDHRYVTAERCRRLATTVANFYNRNSRGVLKLVPVGRTVDVDFKATVANISKAERIAKQRVKADYYIVPSVFKKRGNHASGGIAHLSQMTGWVATHEVGHLLGLGHTGKYLYSKEGNVRKLDRYGDLDSVMSRSGSRYLTAPQYYHKGWLRDDEVALYDPKVRIYELKKISDLKREGLATVVIPAALMRESGQGRPAFVAFSAGCKTGCASLYLANGGGSQKVMTTSGEFEDTRFTNLRIKVLDARPDRVFVSIEKIE